MACCLRRASRLPIYTLGAEYEDFDYLWDQGLGCQGLGGPCSTWPGSVLGSRPAGNPHSGNPPFASSCSGLPLAHPQFPLGSGPQELLHSRGVHLWAAQHGTAWRGPETPSCRYWELVGCCSTGVGSSDHWDRPVGPVGR